MRWFLEKDGKVLQTSREEFLKRRDVESDGVAVDRIADSLQTVIVSTRFIGYDFKVGEVPEPYETLVLHGDLDGFTRRYCTREAALQEHHEVIDKVFRAIEIRRSNDRIPSE